MRTRLNILIVLQVTIVLLLALLVRFTFSIFYQALPDYQKCYWNWTDGISAEECILERNRRI